jgi:malate dehydrogenase
MVPLVNYASVSGIPVAALLKKDQIERIIRLTKSSGADVIKLKGSTVYAPAAVIAIMTDAVLRGRNRVMSVSTYLEGEYGLSDVSIGVPCVLGRNGVERIIELKLDSISEKAFKESACTIKDALLKIDKTA